MEKVTKKDKTTGYNRHLDNRVTFENFQIWYSHLDQLTN